LTLSNSVRRVQIPRLLWGIVAPPCHVEQISGIPKIRGEIRRRLEEGLNGPAAKRSLEEIRPVAK
jgi:hypothetical protein